MWCMAQGECSIAVKSIIILMSTSLHAFPLQRCNLEAQLDVVVTLPPFPPQVSREGILSFRTPLDSVGSPRPFTRLFTGSFDPLIAPLWSNYVLLEDGHVSYRPTNNTEDLDRLARMISFGIDSGIANYRPTLAVIVTWLEFIADRARGSICPVPVPVSPKTAKASK